MKPQDKNSIIELVKAFYDNEYFPYEFSVSSAKEFADILGADETKDFFNQLMKLDNKVIATNVASSILVTDKKFLFEKEIVTKAHQTTKKWAREKYLKAFDNYLFLNDFSNMSSKVADELLELARGFDFNEFDTFTAKRLSVILSLAPYEKVTNKELKQVFENRAENDIEDLLAIRLIISE